MIDREGLLAAARLVDDFDAQRRRETQAFAEGFNVGYQDGYDVGYQRAVEEMAAEWRGMAEQVRRTTTRADPARWVAADAAGLPCSTKCGRCSMCIRADSVRRRGGDYLGQQATRGAA
ncbi:hypothetical protein [Sphaerimonospora mesophila]|uniref:hypothetical protein n=1 Tax=Sphaerimonospora mesophila TaxID=37483 RepID=UPI0006E2AB70